MAKTITKFKIWPRSAMDYVEIWPFDTFQEALQMCIDDFYLNREDIQKAKENWHCDLIKSFNIVIN